MPKLPCQQVAYLLFGAETTAVFNQAERLEKEVAIFKSYIDDEALGK